MGSSNPPTTSNKDRFHGVDRISNLPDSVLCFILSFLETRESVKTCILSKRWKFLWTNVPILDFRYQYSSRRDKNNYLFERFVNTAMLLHKSQSLSKFHLMWEQVDPIFNITAWISAAIARDVQVLDICVSCNFGEQAVDLPASLFTSKSLEFLKLRGNFFVQVPSFVSLPRLETLILELVKYEGDRSVRNLIRGCPILKSLHILRTSYDGVVVFAVSSPTVRHLEIKNLDPPKAKDRKLELNTPLLEYLVLSDLVSQDFTSQSLMSLVELHLCEDDSSYYHDLVYSFYKWEVVKLVQALHRIKILSLGSRTFRAFSEATADASEKFLGVTKLALNTPYWNLNRLLRLIESTVHLQVLELKGVRYFPELGETCENDVPRCLSSSLERISILECFGCVEMFEMMRYFLKHGGFLKRVEIYPGRYVDLSGKYDMIKKISQFSRKSSACEIHVLDRVQLIR